LHTSTTRSIKERIDHPSNAARFIIFMIRIPTYLCGSNRINVNLPRHTEFNGNFTMKKYFIAAILIAASAALTAPVYASVNGNDNQSLYSHH